MSYIFYLFINFLTIFSYNGEKKPEKNPMLIKIPMLVTWEAADPIMIPPEIVPVNSKIV